MGFTVDHKENMEFITRVTSYIWSACLALLYVSSRESCEIFLRDQKSQTRHTVLAKLFRPFIYPRFDQISVFHLDIIDIATNLLRYVSTSLIFFFFLPICLHKIAQTQSDVMEYLYVLNSRLWLGHFNVENVKMSWSGGLLMRMNAVWPRVTWKN